MEVPDTASTTSSSKSSSSKTSSNEAGAASSDACREDRRKPNTGPTGSRGHNNMNKDLANAILQRLQEHDTSSPRFAPTTTGEDDTSNSNKRKRAHHSDRMNSKVSASSSDGGPTSDSGGPSSDSGGPSSNSGSGSGSNSNRSSSSDNSSNVPVWSEEPAVNVLAILLILQDLEKTRQENERGNNNNSTEPEERGEDAPPAPQDGESSAHKATSTALVKTVLKRLGDLGGWNPQDLSDTDLTSLLRQLQSKCVNPNSEDGDAVMMTTDSDSHAEKKLPPKERNRGEEVHPNRAEQEPLSSGETTLPTEDSMDGSPGSASPPEAACLMEPQAQMEPRCAAKESPTTTSGTRTTRKKKPTKQELLAALQQHLDILHQRGQVSSVIPRFLRPTNGTAREQEDEGEQEASSTLAVRKAKRRRKTPTRDDYYEELAAELLSHSAVPIPESVDVPDQDKAQQALENQQPQQLTESEDSDLSVSLCSSGSTPNSSDFESSTGDTTTTGTTTTGTGSTSLRRRSVGFANSLAASTNASTQNDAKVKVSRAMSTLSGSSGDAQGESSSSSGSSGDQQGESSS